MIDTFSRISFLKKIHLFSGMTEEDLARLADQLVEYSYPPGKMIYDQNKKADNFYLIYSGSVRIVNKKQGKVIDTSNLVANDYFGYLDIIKRRTRSGTATALTNTLVLALSRENFEQLHKMSPDFRLNMDIDVRSRNMARGLRFQWLTEGETIYFLARKHPIILVRNLLGPFLALFAPAFILFWWATSWQTLLLLFLAGAIFLLDVLWAIWLILDWGNDYYIVTSQRVVWLEKVIALYDSRQESPLNTILAVAAETSLLGRWFDFGDVVVRTYVSKIIFRSVHHPRQAQYMIEEYWKRTRETAVGTERTAMEAALFIAQRRRQGLQVAPPPPAPAMKKADFPQDKGLDRIARFFGADRLRLRYEKGDTVIYRKHWIVLIEKAWIPILGLLTITGLFFYRLYLLFTSPDALLSTENGIVSVDAWAGSLTILFFIFLVWFIYDFVDWSNDRFEVTNEQIVDVYKKPLSTEIRNASQLENILGTEYERLGILGQMFNYGTVFITVGSTKLTFEDVRDPATVQADIDRRRMAQRARKEEKEKAAERERMAEWLITYHQNAEKLRQEEEQRKKRE